MKATIMISLVIVIFFTPGQAGVIEAHIDKIAATENLRSVLLKKNLLITPILFSTVPLSWDV